MNPAELADLARLLLNKGLVSEVSPDTWEALWMGAERSRKYPEARLQNDPSPSAYEDRLQAAMLELFPQEGAVVRRMVAVELLIEHFPATCREPHAFRFGDVTDVELKALVSLSVGQVLGRSDGPFLSIDPNAFARRPGRDVVPLELSPGLPVRLPHEPGFGIITRPNPGLNDDWRVAYIAPSGEPRESAFMGRELTPGFNLSPNEQATAAFLKRWGDVFFLQVAELPDMPGFAFVVSAARGPS